MRTHARPRRGGFTLIELLVVIGIVVILLGILIPTVSTVRKSAQTATTQAQVASLAAAIDRYHADYRAYPGPIPNQQISQPPTPPFTAVTVSGIGPNLPGNPTHLELPGGGITMSENLVLALCGGWDPAPSGTGPPSYVPESVMKGPMSHNPVAMARKRGPAYVDNTSWLSNQPGNMVEAYNALSGGPTWEYVGSAVPEFVDRYSEPRPILYLRARVGAPISPSGASGPEKGLAGDDDLKYNWEHLLRYKVPRGPVGPKDPSDFYNIVEGRDFNEDDWRGFDRSGQYIPGYLENPGIRGQPRQVDRYILISAGPDRAYGTTDDIFNP